jgi:two-component system NarL family sensor kinase
LRAAKIRCRFDLAAALPEWRLTSSERHNLFHVLKEALHNIVKHSHATEVWLRTELAEDGFQLTIADDGQGLGGTGAGESSTGNGLTNMRERIESLGGRLRLSTQPENSLSVTIWLPLNLRR